MKKFIKFLPAAMAAMAFTFVSCGGDDSEPDGNGGEGEVLTIEETKERVGSVAETFMSKFNPEDQREVLEFLDYIGEVYGSFDVEGDEEEYYPMRQMGRSAEIIDLVNDVPSGIYTPDADGEWVKTGNSDDVVFRIPDDARYGNIDLTVKRSGGKSEFDVTVPEEGDYHLVIPTKVSAVLTANGKTMATEVLEANLNLANKTLSATETFSAANLKVSATVNATNTRANVNSYFTVSGEQLISATGTVTGNNLCDIDVIAEVLDNENFDKLFQSCNAKANVMNQLFADLKVSLDSKMLEAMDSWFSFGSEYADYASESAASSACDAAVSLINRYLNGNISFTDGGVSQAKLVYIKEADFWQDYNGNRVGEFYPELSIMFADGTTYTDEFFEYGFDSVLNRFDALIDAYKNICR